jgi:hypothetical protein
MHQDTVMDEHSILAAFSQAAALALQCALRQPTVRGLRRASSGWLKGF